MVLFAKESELNEIWDLMKSYEEYKRITYILYIVKENVKTPYKSVFYDPSNPSYSNNTIFPINLMRDLAIESIDTTHYFVSDIDVFSSDTLYDTLRKHNETLKDPKAVLLLKSFLMNEQVVDHSECYKKGVCHNMYSLFIIDDMQLGPSTS